MLRAIFGVSLMLLLAGCASTIKPAFHKAPVAKTKFADPCPCSPTANEVVKRRWFSGYRVKLFH